MMAVCASCVETLAEGHAALGHRHAVPSGVHRVTGVAVSSVSWAVHVWCPAVAVKVVHGVLTGETLEASGKGSS